MELATGCSVASSHAFSPRAVRKTMITSGFFPLRMSNFGYLRYAAATALRVEVERSYVKTSRNSCRQRGLRAGMVDGLVDEFVKFSKAGGTMVLNSYNLVEPIRQLSGGIALLPSQSESVLRGILATAASVMDRKETNVHHGFAKQRVLTDSLRQGRMIENLLLYRQTFIIRSYEVGADKTASIETLMNLFQETALNHVWLSGIGGGGFGTTKAMVRNGLIWVVSRLHVEVDCYPAWGDVVEMDSWVASSGKNGMRRDWLLRSVQTGQILGRATSTWVMMHHETRKLSKMPDDVRAEISPFFLERRAVPNEVSLKINKLQNDSALYISSGLQARRSDLDMNQHVNNVKYIAWMMESVPKLFLENLEIKSITLEYRRECGQADVVESLTSPEDTTTSNQVGNGTSKGERVDHPDFPHLSGPISEVSIVTAENLQKESEHCPHFTHLLKMQDGAAEIVRGRTSWKSKPRSKHVVPIHG